MGNSPNTPLPTPLPADDDAWAEIIRQGALVQRADQTFTPAHEARKARLRRFPATNAEADELIQEQQRERAALVAQLGLH